MTVGFSFDQIVSRLAWKTSFTLRWRDHHNHNDNHRCMGELINSIPVRVGCTNEMKARNPAPKCPGRVLRGRFNAKPETLNHTALSNLKTPPVPEMPCDDARGSKVPNLAQYGVKPLSRNHRVTRKKHIKKP